MIARKHPESLVCGVEPEGYDGSGPNYISRLTMKLTKSISKGASIHAKRSRFRKLQYRSGASPPRAECIIVPSCDEARFVSAVALASQVLSMPHQRTSCSHEIAESVEQIGRKGSNEKFCILFGRFLHQWWKSDYSSRQYCQYC